MLTKDYNLEINSIALYELINNTPAKTDKGIEIYSQISLLTIFYNLDLDVIG